MFTIVADIRYYYMIVMVPMAALIPDITVNLVNQIFYPVIEDTLMFMQSELAGLLPREKPKKKKKLSIIEGESQVDKRS